MSEREITDALDPENNYFYLSKNWREEVHNCRDKLLTKDFSTLFPSQESSLPFLYWAVQCKQRAFYKNYLLLLVFVFLSRQLVGIATKLTGTILGYKNKDKKSILVFSLDLLPDLLYRADLTNTHTSATKGVNSDKRGQERHFSFLTKHIL